MTAFDPPRARVVAFLAPLTKSRAVAILIAAVFAGVFVLPWVVPARIAAVQSESQAAGFNNSVAMLTLGAGAAALFALARVGRRSGSLGSQRSLVSVQRATLGDRVSPWLVGIVIALVVLMVGATSAVQQDYPFGDAQYFTNVMLRVAAGGAPYTQIEFSYGPLLLYPPLVTWELLRWTGLSIYPVYYFWVALSQSLGLGLTAFVLNHIRLSRALRNAALLFVGGLALAQPTLGLNYTPLRYLLPFAVLVFVLKRVASSPSGVFARILPILGFLLAAGVSPEMGIALLIALSVALLLLVIRDPRAYLASLWVLVAGALGTAAALSMAGPGTLAAFASGAYYLPVLPGLPALIFVSTILALAWGIGSVFEYSGNTDAALQAGWLTLALILVSPALGRADATHIVFNGLGAMLACAAVVDRKWHRAGAYLSVSAVVYIGAMSLYSVVDATPQMLDAGLRTGAIPKSAAVSVANALGRSHMPEDRDWDEKGATRDGERQAAARLAELPGLAFPSALMGEVGLRLADSRHLVPVYSAGPLDSVAFRTIVAQLRVAQNLVLPTSEFEQYEVAGRCVNVGPDGSVMTLPAPVGGLTRFGLMTGFPLELSARNEVFDPQASIGALLVREWVAYDRIGGYTVLRRR
jgi:hypothetical protein